MHLEKLFTPKLRKTILKRLNKLIDVHPFSLGRYKKRKNLQEELKYLNEHHYNNCIDYKYIVDAIGYNRIKTNNLEQYPFLHVDIFKEYDLKSIKENKIFKIMNSSGTSGANTSKIYIDKENAKIQTKILKTIVSDFIGKSRMPMLIIDSESTVKTRGNFSARTAGIVGFSIFGKDHTFALNDQLELNVKVLKNFFQKYTKQSVLVFGFTYLIWEKFIEQLNRNNIKLPKLNGFLIHGGGWKKLIEKKIDNATFKKKIENTIGIENSINYYGMIEQTGSIYLECKYGFLHTSIFSDIIIRRPDYSLCSQKEKGIVQTISLLPTSYPGHNLISDDLGEIIAEDNCKCGRLGKTFLIHGRIRKSELRGCSDTID